MRKRRTIILGVVAALLGLVIFFPLRMAIELSTGPETALSARQVGGTVWKGRVGDLGLAGQPLGTFDVSARPLPLLIGRVELDAVRLDAGEGPLSARVITGGGREGVADATGRLAVSHWLAPIPVEALMLDDVTLLFDDGRCAEADGSISLVPSFSSPLPIEDLEGQMSCDESGRGVAELASERGGHRVRLLFDAQGGIEGEARTRSAPPALAAALQLFGFSVEGSDLVLRTSVR